MKKRMIVILAIAFSLLSASHVHANNGVFLGLQAGYSAQRPSLSDIEFNTNTTFLYGARVGIKFFMMSLEANYFQAAHNLELSEFTTFHWGDRQIDYNYLGLNLKYFFPLLTIHPYITLGYGYYTVEIQQIDKDTNKGFNFGLGIELLLGGKLSLLAEGKYHIANLDIEDQNLKIGDFTISGGFNFYF